MNVVVDLKAIKRLVYSLQLTAGFAERIDSINSSEEFLIIHNRNINSLKDLSKTRQTDYFLKKVDEYPVIKKIELDEYIKNRKGSMKIMWVIGGWLMVLISLIIGIARTKGNNLGGTKNKLNDIKRINNSLIYVIENPGFEGLIESKNNA